MAGFEELILENAPTTVRGGRSDWDEEGIREFLQYLKDMGKQVVYIDTKKFFEQFKISGKGYSELKYPGWTARKVLLKFAEKYDIKDVIGGNKVLTIKF